MGWHVRSHAFHPSRHTVRPSIRSFFAGGETGQCGPDRTLRATSFGNQPVNHRCVFHPSKKAPLRNRGPLKPLNQRTFSSVNSVVFSDSVVFHPPPEFGAIYHPNHPDEVAPDRTLPRRNGHSPNQTPADFRCGRIIHLLAQHSERPMPDTRRPARRRTNDGCGRTIDLPTVLLSRACAGAFGGRRAGGRAVERWRGETLAGGSGCGQPSGA